MTVFDDREKAFENKFTYKNELEFKIGAKTAKRLGLWAAGLLGLDGEEAKAYAGQVVETNINAAGIKAMVQKILGDFEKSKIDVSEKRIFIECEKQHEAVKKLVMKDVKSQ